MGALSAEVKGAATLLPEQQEVANELVSLCNALPKSPRSRQLDELIRKADTACSKTTYLAGENFSVADACLLPFLQRVEDDIPSSATHLRSYMTRVHELPAFSRTIVDSWWWWW